jgi:protein-serine/threonine kinase
MLTWTPAVVTAEKASAAKIFFECHYNTALSNEMTPRSLRRQALEYAMANDPNMSIVQVDENRRELAQRETNNLRETRVIKARGIKALKGKEATASKYEVVKVLGKGSFGVVRLVREKRDNTA